VNVEIAQDVSEGDWGGWSSLHIGPKLRAGYRHGIPVFTLYCEMNVTIEITGKDRMVFINTNWEVGLLNSNDQIG
jgi:hypothetical protein